MPLLPLGVGETIECLPFVTVDVVWIVRTISPALTRRGILKEGQYRKTSRHAGSRPCRCCRATPPGSRADSHRGFGARWLMATDVRLLSGTRRRDPRCAFVGFQSAFRCATSSLAAKTGADPGPRHMDSVEEAGTAQTTSLYGCRPWGLQTSCTMSPDVLVVAHVRSCWIPPTQPDKLRLLSRV